MNLRVFWLEPSCLFPHLLDFRGPLSDNELEEVEICVAKAMKDEDGIDNHELLQNNDGFSARNILPTTEAVLDLEITVIQALVNKVPNCVVVTAKEQGGSWTLLLHALKSSDASRQAEQLLNGAYGAIEVIDPNIEGLMTLYCSKKIARADFTNTCQDLSKVLQPPAKDSLDVVMQSDPNSLFS